MATIALTTICLNAEATLQRCMNSVKAQISNPDEYIIVDGKSHDSTPALIAKEMENGLISRFVSEPDEGISDAFNKAWNLAKSDYVATLNADDWIDENYLKSVRDIIEKDQSDIVISAMVFSNSKRQKIIQPDYFSMKAPIPWRHPAINHPGMVIRKSLLEKVGGYEPSYKIAMDVDLFYKLLQHSPSISILKQPSVYQRDGGVSQKKWRLALTEMRRIEIEHGRPSLSAWGAYLWRSSKQTLKHLMLWRKF
jgi:glycosyltransferase involved in cell wall biosynthesis